MKTTILFVSLLNGVGNLGWSILPSDVTARRRFATWSGQKPSGPMSEELNLGGGCTRGNERTDGRIGFLIPFSLSQKKSPRNGEIGKEILPQKEGIPSFPSRRGGDAWDDFAAVFGSGFGRARTTSPPNARFSKQNSARGPHPFFSRPKSHRLFCCSPPTVSVGAASDADGDC